MDFQTLSFPSPVQRSSAELASGPANGLANGVRAPASTQTPDAGGGVGSGPGDFSALIEAQSASQTTPSAASGQQSKPVASQGKPITFQAPILTGSALGQSLGSLNGLLGQIADPSIAAGQGVDVPVAAEAETSNAEPAEQDASDAAIGQADAGLSQVVLANAIPVEPVNLPKAMTLQGTGSDQDGAQASSTDAAALLANQASPANQASAANLQPLGTNPAQPGLAPSPAQMAGVRGQGGWRSSALQDANLSKDSTDPAEGPAEGKVAEGKAAEAQANPSAVREGLAQLRQLQGLDTDPRHAHNQHGSHSAGASAREVQPQSQSVHGSATTHVTTNGDQANAGVSGASQSPSAESQTPAASGVETSAREALANSQLPAAAASGGLNPLPTLTAIAPPGAQPSGVIPQEAPPAAPPQAQSPIPLQGPALAERISVAALNGETRLDLRLDPPELGAMELRIEVAADNSVRASISVERPEVLAELMRAARDIERTLSQAGFTLARDALSFQLSGQHGGSERQGRDQSAGQNGKASWRDYSDEASSALPAAPLRLASHRVGRLDLVI